MQPRRGCRWCPRPRFREMALAPAVGGWSRLTRHNAADGSRTVLALRNKLRTVPRAPPQSHSFIFNRSIGNPSSTRCIIQSALRKICPSHASVSKRQKAPSFKAKRILLTVSDRRQHKCSCVSAAPSSSSRRPPSRPSQALAVLPRPALARTPLSALDPLSNLSWRLACCWEWALLTEDCLRVVDVFAVRRRWKTGATDGGCGGCVVGSSGNLTAAQVLLQRHEQNGAVD